MTDRIYGSAVFRGDAWHHKDHSELYDDWWKDMHHINMLEFDRDGHLCVWSRDAERLERNMKAVRRLAEAGLVLLEDSPSGPMVTRTWRGTRAIRDWPNLPSKRLHLVSQG